MLCVLPAEGSITVLSTCDEKMYSSIHMYSGLPQCRFLNQNLHLPTIPVMKPLSPLSFLSYPITTASEEPHEQGFLLLMLGPQPFP